MHHGTLRATPRRASGGFRGSRRHRSFVGVNAGGNAGDGREEEAFEVVKYGLGKGSTAYYPRGGRPVSSSSIGVPRLDTDPSTRYEDGVLDKLAIALFNAKLESAVNEGTPGQSSSSAAVTSPPLPAGGFPRLVALADRIAESNRSPIAQRQVVLNTLLGLIPGFVRRLFKILIKPATWVDKMNAIITVEAFAWLVGPCEIVPRETDGVMAAVKLRKCRYLEQCGCTASCVNFCKRPTEGFFREAFGVDAHLAPNHEDGSCIMTFGVAAPVPDPAFDKSCYASCSKAATCSALGEAGNGVGAREEDAPPCHRLGEE